MFKTIISRYFTNEGPKFIKAVKAIKKAEKPQKPPKEAEPAEEMPSDPAEALKYKRDFKRSFHSTYDSQKVESYWYDWWAERKLFHTPAKEVLSVDPSKRFVIILPPPNVTGKLHVGHALTGAVEDCMVRWRLLKGYKTVYVPGVDHAGIATQSVVEKTLLKQGVDKNALGREQFVKKVWEWKEEYGDAIVNQLKRLGSALDWDRFSFTMDDTRSEAVKETFVRLHQKGLIYRANRLVNWSCALRTAISDIEVESEEVSGPTKYKVPSDPTPAEIGVLIEFAYKVRDSDEEIVVATTRLETMLGDVAVAVNSNDPRYKHLVGKQLVHPFIPDRRMVVLTDDVLVDMNFGTGAVKITPAHDPNDFECGKRNNLEFVNIMRDDGTLNDNAGPFANMPRYTVRRKMEEDLERMGLLRGKKNNPMVLSVCSKSKDIIEPLIKPQWYVDCKDISKRMVEVAENGSLKIIPEYRTKIWHSWLKNSQDWCISRQLWWGHRVPAYRARRSVARKEYLTTPDGADEWFIGRNEEEVRGQLRDKHPDEQFELEQDEDVLDTWFSSALLPFANFGWPNTDSEDFRAFFPNTILETGHDILFFWVARMVMMSLLLTDQLPFKTVYLHNLIRDENGEKMSKSKGNVIDPLEVIDGCRLESIIETVQKSLLSENEKKQTILDKKKKFPEGIPRCGTDALRFGLLSNVSEAKDLNLDVNVVVSVRIFCNKIWNAYKLARSLIGEDFLPNASLQDFRGYPPSEKWVFGKFEECAKSMNAALESHKYSDATEAFSGFWLYAFCDFYLEYAKTVDRSDLAAFSATQNMLFFVVNGSLRLLHPIMPFLTEELYQKLPFHSSKRESIMQETYPEFTGLLNDDPESNDFDVVIKAIQVVRQLLGVFKLPPNASPPLFFASDSVDSKELAVLKTYSKYVQKQTKVGEISVVGTGDAPKQSLKGIVTLAVNAHLLLKDSVKFNEEKLKINQEIVRVSEQIAKTKTKMAKEDYATKVPEKIRLQDAEFLTNFELQLGKLKDTLELILSMA